MSACGCWSLAAHTLRHLPHRPFSTSTLPPLPHTCVNACCATCPLLHATKTSIPAELGFQTKQPPTSNSARSSSAEKVRDWSLLLSTMAADRPCLATCRWYTCVHVRVPKHKGKWALCVRARAGSVDGRYEHR